jgi:dimethylamine---corrinoid protein Co-methyltransferase
MEVGHTDYPVKPAKPIVVLEQTHVEAVLHTIVIPVSYGFMPNLGLYCRPDGPFANPADLLDVRINSVERLNQKMEI